MTYWPFADPDFQAWCAEQDVADAGRAPIPIESVPEFIAGREQAALAVALLAAPGPDALARAKAALRRASALIPQPRLDQYCRSERWGKRIWGDPRSRPAELCTRPTCGRCVPLRGHQAAAEADPGA